MAEPSTKHVRNKQIVLDFFKTLINDRDPLKAAELFVGDRYIQHNPLFESGPQIFAKVFVPWLEENRELSVDIKRAIAEDDLVVLHIHLKMNKEDRGTATIDIFRLENEKIVEHWDVVQPIPETSANANTMF